MHKIQKVISYICLCIFSSSALAGQIIVDENTVSFENIEEFYCSTSLGSIGVLSADDKKVYHSTHGNFSIASFTPQLRFYINTVEDSAICKNPLSNNTEINVRTGFVFSQAFNYLDCDDVKLECGTKPTREVAQIILKGEWRAPLRVPKINKRVNFGSTEYSKWSRLVDIQNLAHGSLGNYYNNNVIKEYGSKARFHGEVFSSGVFRQEPIITSSETFTRWWIPADCKVDEKSHCSHTVLLFRATTSKDTKISSPTDFSISPWFTKELVITSWSPFTQQDHILRLTLKK